MDHRSYLQWLYTNSWNNHFKARYDDENKQFCIATLDQIKDQSNYGTQTPSWKAVSFAESGKEVDQINGKPKHAEVAIIYKLPDMILQYFTIENKFPENIYFFTLHAPCPSRARRLATMIDLTWACVKSRFTEQDMIVPPNDIATWEEYFEHHFATPLYHFGWDKKFEEEEGTSGEGVSQDEKFAIITDEFERAEIQPYNEVTLDKSLHVPSQTMNDYFSEHGSLLD